MSFRAAIIDLGTNTFHILIFEWEGNQYKVLHKLQIPVKLGKGAFGTHTIKEDAYSRGIAAMIEFKTIIEQYKLAKIEVYGTSVLRNASNGAAFAKECESIINAPVHIIDGNREAEMIYAGVKRSVPLGREPHLIMDIGGGSVEFIIADEKTIFWRKSYEIGAARLIENFVVSDPMEDKSIHELEDFLEKELNALWTKTSKYQVSTLVGASGSFESLSSMEMEIYHSNSQSEHFLHHIVDMHHFEEIYHKVITSTQEELLRIPGLPAFRVEMMSVAFILMHYIIHRAQLKKMITSDYALKEGVMFTLMQEPLPVVRDLKIQ